ncbi:hypothetical protein [Haliangium sp. UPWRP_2]|nr:hypothetical protein [Haliangium sp. UPWRP_2]
MDRRRLRPSAQRPHIVAAPTEAGTEMPNRDPPPPDRKFIP